MREPQLRRMKDFNRSWSPPPSRPTPTSTSPLNSDRLRKLPTKPCFPTSFPTTLSPWIYSTENDNPPMAAGLSNNATPKEFHLFGKLPLELRRKIWGFATPPPWILIHSTIHTGYTRQVPAVLHTCKESREEFLYDEEVQKHHPTYKLVSGLIEHNLKAVFVSLEQDVVMIHSEYTPMIKALRGLKRVALQRFGDNSAVNMLSDWPSIEHILCIDPAGRCDFDTQSSFDYWFASSQVSTSSRLKQYDQDSSNGPEYSYLIKLKPDIDLQSGPLFLGQHVERRVKSIGPNVDRRMNCYLFSQGEEQEMDGSGEILMEMLADMKDRIVRIHRCGGGGRRFNFGPPELS